MSAITASDRPVPAQGRAQTLQNVLVALMFLTSFYAKFEPAPMDIFFVLATVVCVYNGLQISMAIMPLFILLLIYNLAGLLSYTLIPFDQLGAPAYIIGLAETSSSAVFVAAFVASDPIRNYKLIMKYYWIGATIGSILGLLIYFKVAPFYPLFPDFFGRVIGGYKDPNVFSTWLVFPTLAMLHAFMIGTLRFRPLNIASFLLMFAALFLAFSRGAWFDIVLGVIMLVTISFALSPHSGLRARITFSAIAGTFLLAAMLVLLLSVPSTREVFLDRFTLVKSYDAGETGRFGLQLRSIPMLLQLPFGFGPYQFGEIFGIAPHNTFLNSFAAAGWIGGISYILFTVSTIIVGVRTLLIRTPFQPYAIVAFCGFTPMIIQGFQIDCEHWRHLYWMTGMVWGFHAASFKYMNAPCSVREYHAGWNIAQAGSR